ncbi:hypothetical protein K493DRAFT_370033 [Basidiobolus meristosporus CBS 931.73]|uniref:Uncharacterized protein n=1 Tax=Basidiobolus meristosporus CBS 931.73 TaxID=1314790 RepID=A0A1Y1YGP6_9FUNG|nr:hypothetical protein K493DRAFT_370033 [Basidiobolus meristosporus CBS 931.73]|eukprot:ORX97220.1 hypothetical protein K493DRAFT_370033 [Basidiobolus meristosporus CBS 931.73]
MQPLKLDTPVGRQNDTKADVSCVSTSPKPLPVWSAISNDLVEDSADERELARMSPTERKQRRKIRSASLAVPGLDPSYPSELLQDYDIPAPFWSRFIQALNAALSELPASKDPKTLSRKRSQSFTHGDRRPSLTSERTQVTKAEQVLNWWNEDFFQEKGCRFNLGFEAISEDESKPYLTLSPAK